MKRLLGVWARPPQTRQRRKTGQNSDFGAKTTVTALKIQFFLIQNLNFKPLLALLVSNITYMKRLRSMGAGETSTDEKTSKNRPKQCKTVQNSDFGAKTTVTALKIQIF